MALPVEEQQLILNEIENLYNRKNFEKLQKLIKDLTAKFDEVDGRLDTLEAP